MAVTVCLDAGHFGKRNQSPVVKAYFESEMNWKLQGFLKSALEARGIAVITTRQALEKDLSLYARGRAGKGCDLFLSLHSNACGSEEVDRPVVIVQLDGKGDALGNKLGETIRRVMETQDDYQLYKRKDKSGGEYYGVLRSAAQVGVLGIILEHSFHTNARAANWLLDESNLKCLAEAEAQVLGEYFSLAEPELLTSVDPARQFTKSYAGSYRVESGDGFLNLRTGASTGKPILEAMATGSMVRCYGYYTGNWLYVVSPSGKTGYCHKAYLKRS